MTTALVKILQLFIPLKNELAQIELALPKKVSYFFAKVMAMGFWGVILKPWSACMAMDDWTSSSNSTKAIPGFASIIRTSLNPGYCRKSNSSIILVVSWGKFSMNNILFGAAASCALAFPWRNGAWTKYIEIGSWISTQGKNIFFEYFTNLRRWLLREERISETYCCGPIFSSCAIRCSRLLCFFCTSLPFSWKK